MSFPVLVAVVSLVAVVVVLVGAVRESVVAVDESDVREFTCCLGSLFTRCGEEGVLAKVEEEGGNVAELGGVISRALLLLILLLWCRLLSFGELGRVIVMSPKSRERRGGREGGEKN